VARQINSILSDDGARSYIFGAGGKLTLPGRPVAAKTGTTNDYRDGWTVGYTPSLVAGVWVGNNDNTPMNPLLASGITGAAPIWNGIMTDLLKDKVNETFKVPSGVLGKEICSATGGLKNEKCNNRFEYFLAGTEPTKDTFTKVKIWVERGTGKIVPPGTPNSDEKEEVLISDPYSKQDFCATCPLPGPTPSPNP